jgi:hypothetical protein
MSDLPSNSVVTEAPQLPPNHVLVVREITRAHSSGSKTSWRNIFTSYEEASEYIISQFKRGGMAKLCWSEEQYDVSGTEHKRMRSPTLKFAQTKFSPAALEEFIRTPKFSTAIYGPYDSFCCHVPYEIRIELYKLE